MGKTFSTGLLTNGLWQDSSNNIGIGAAANASFKLQVTGATNLTGALTGAAATFSGNLLVGPTTSGFDSVSQIASSSTGNIISALTLQNTSLTETAGTGVNLNFGGRLNWLGRISTQFVGTTGGGDASMSFLTPSGGTLAARLTIASTGAATFSSSVNIASTTTIGGIDGSFLRTYSATNDTLRWAFINSSSGVFSIQQQGDNYVNQGDRLVINRSGNVGIGTTTTSYRLNVVTSASAGLYISTSGSSFGSPSIAMLDGATDTTISATSNGLEISTYSSHPMLFRTAQTERMRITSEGYTKASNNGTYRGATDPYHEFVQTANDRNTIFRSTNASYTSNMLLLDAVRSANSAYSFLFANSGDNTDREFDLKGDGNGYADGAWTGGGADYAEYFEWADGNINNEDRRGYSVSLVNNKIKIAEQGENIIGVISANPSIVGDAAWNKWNGKYLKDEFNSYILDEDGHRTLNPNYDEKAEYIPREQRPEWSVVGLMGKLRIRKGQATMPTWIKMRDVSENVEEWLIK
jgi:hypothetical protein